METTTIEVIKLKASEGMMLSNADESFVCSELYLGKHETAANWHEITKERADEIEAEQQAKAKQEQEREQE